MKLIGFLHFLFLVLLLGVTNAETFHYDAAGRLVAVVYPNDSAVTYAYDPDGNLQTVRSLLPGEDLDGDDLGDSWEIGYFGTVLGTGSQDNTDNDPEKLGVEFAFSLNPLGTNDTAHLPSLAKGLDEKMILTYARNRHARFLWQYWVADDLGHPTSWFPAVEGTHFQILSIVVSPTNMAEVVSIELLPQPGKQQFFLRVQAQGGGPVVAPIGDQFVVAPDLFAPVMLDGYVSDPNTADSEIVWAVSGATQLSVSLSNRVAAIQYPIGPRGSAISERLTFTATDPDGLSATAGATFSVSFSEHSPPVVSSIPSQSVIAPNFFAPIQLDDFVSDPDTADSNMVWIVSGAMQLGVGITNGFATISYPAGLTNTISELLTFQATDPQGLWDSTTASFTVAPPPPDYSLTRGASVTDFRIFSASPAVWSLASYYDYAASNQFSWLSYQDLGVTRISATDGRADYLIGAASNAPIGIAKIRVTYYLLDASLQPLGPLTNNVYDFRIEVTQ